MAFTNEEKKLLYWQLAVEGMDILNIPEGEYEAARKSGKYDRFTTFVKEFAEKLREARLRMDYTVDRYPPAQLTWATACAADRKL